jgi:transposase
LITDEVYVEIQLLKNHGWSLRQIVEKVGCAVNTVRRHLESPTLPKYERQAKRETKLAPHETYLRARQEAAKPLWIPATVLYREIKACGYQGEMNQLRAFLRTLRPMEPLVSFETAMGARTKERNGGVSVLNRC